MFTFHFILLLNLVLANSELCNLLINEINADDPAKWGSYDFLELQSFCNGEPKSISLQGYKILGLTTGTGKHNSPEIGLIINPWNWRTNKNGFLTVGAGSVRSADYKIPNDYVKYTQKYLKGAQPLLQFLQTGGRSHLKAIAVVYGQKNAFPTLNLSEKMAFIALNEEVKNLLKKHIVDLVVYGKNAPFDQCGLFEELYPEYKGKKYVLREYDTADDLMNTTCSGFACRTLERYYSTQVPLYFEIPLYGNNDPFPWLDEIRSDFIHSLLEELDSYFPDTRILTDLDIFSPERMPSTTADALSYGVQEIRHISDYFKWDKVNELLDAWSVLLESFVRSSRLCAFKAKETKSFAFWSEMLISKEIAWKPNTKKLIYTILSLPIASADAERGFSIMNHIRTSRRSRLGPESLDALMRVRINGPNNIDRFAASKYAKKWIEENHMKTDDASRAAKLQSKNLEETDIGKRFERMPESAIV